MAPRKNNFGISGLLDTPMVPLDNEYYDRLSTQGLANQARRNEKVAAELQHLQNAENGGDNAASLVRMNQRKQAADANYDAAMQTIWPGRQTSQVNNAAAPQQNAPQPQRTTTGGGQAIAAENPDQQQHGPGGTTETRRLGGVDANVETDQNGRVTSVFSSTPNSPGYGMIRLTGTPNRQAAQRPQPGLGYNQDAAQQAAGWRNLHEPGKYGGAGGYRNVRDADGNIRPGLFAIRGNAGGYGFQGSEKDAALFAAPVWKPAYQVQNKPNLTFLQYERARRAAPAIDSRPNWDDYKGMTWQTRIKKYQIDMDAWDKQRARAMGYDPEMEKLAMQREQLAQQYGFNMAQAGNDALRAQAALGLNWLQQQGQQLQNAQAARLDAIRRQMMTVRPGSKEWLDLYKNAQALEGNLGKQEQDKMSDVATINDPVNGSYQVQNIRDANGNVYQRRVTEQGGQGHPEDPNGEQLISILQRMTPKEQQKYLNGTQEDRRKMLQEIANR